ncbi:MAG: universal stress protein [Deltaproteobacteria bacterium]|jgi:nucleotide-binding universal stress UspA family protein|nr:universal stress protein [Deltaproteobacteria bacterium]
MWKLDKILIPVDGSEYSFKAAKFSTNCAKQFNSTVIILHCHKPDFCYANDKDYDAIHARIEDKAEDMLDRYREIYDEAGVKHWEIIPNPPAAQAIVEVAEKEGVDIIMMGTHGRTDLQGLLLGSVTHKVLHLAPCPVLVIR